MIKNINTRLFSASVLASLVVAGCAQESNASNNSEKDDLVVTTAFTDEGATPVDGQSAEQSQENNLPLVNVSTDEDGPSTLAGMVDEATTIVWAKLVEVRPGTRYYGPDEEAPDATAFEEVELVFEPIEIYKGENKGENLTIPWTAYTTNDTKSGSKRLDQVSVNGLKVNEKAIGQQYGLFIKENEDGTTGALTTGEGIVPLNPAGKITGRKGGGGVLVHELTGQPFSDIL